MDKQFINWVYAKDPNEFNELCADMGTMKDSIISITYDSNHGCYVMFYWDEGE